MRHAQEDFSPYTLALPKGEAIPLICDSPHSGTTYPADFGYALDEPFWGRGYATEMAAAVLRYGFRDLGLPRLHAIATLDNHASHRVLLKIGMKRNGERAFSHPAYVEAGPMAWFERDRDAWMTERNGAQEPT